MERGRLSVLRSSVLLLIVSSKEKKCATILSRTGRVANLGRFSVELFRRSAV